MREERGNATALMPAVVVGLGVTQIIGYGSLYYAYALLVPSIARDIGTSVPWLFGVFSGATLAFGLMGPVSGRAADRYGGPRVMAAGSAAAAISLGAMALAPEPWSFAAAVVVMQLASALVLYETAFVTLVQLDAADARRRITHLTLIAGFASTIFWPLTSWLLSVMDWRQVLLVFALAHALVCLPIHALIARPGAMVRPSTAEGAPDVPVAPVEPPQLAISERRRGIALAMAGFALSGVVLSALSFHLVPMLVTAGLGGAASGVAALFGPAQVASRLINLGFGARLTAVALVSIATALVFGGLAVQLLGGMSVGPAIVFSVLLGLGSGLMSVARGTVPLALLGPEGYGRMLGQFTLVRVLASAMAPVAMSLLFEAIGIHGALAVTAAIMAASLTAFLILLRLTTRATAAVV